MSLAGLCVFLHTDCSGCVVAGGVKPTYQAAGTHTPALLEECIRELTAADPAGVYVDGTFGRGGHTRGLLKKLAPTAQMHGFDLDPEAITAAKELVRPSNPAAPCCRGMLQQASAPTSVLPREFPCCRTLQAWVHAPPMSDSDRLMQRSCAGRRRRIPASRSTTARSASSARHSARVAWSPPA